MTKEEFEKCFPEPEITNFELRPMDYERFKKMFQKSTVFLAEENGKAYLYSLRKQKDKLSICVCDMSGRSFEEFLGKKENTKPVYDKHKNPFFGQSAYTVAGQPAYILKTKDGKRVSVNEMGNVYE